MLKSECRRLQRATPTIPFQNSPSYFLMRCTFLCFPAILFNDALDRPQRATSTIFFFFSAQSALFSSEMHLLLLSHQFCPSQEQKTEQPYPSMARSREADSILLHLEPHNNKNEHKQNQGEWVAATSCENSGSVLLRVQGGGSSKMYMRKAVL